MPVITFWSESEKETGQTMSAIALATDLGIDHNHKILLITTKYSDDDLETSFWDVSKSSKNKLSFLGGNKKVSLDSGISGLAKAANSNRLSPEMITDYTKIVFRERLEILSGYKSEEGKEQFYKIQNTYLDLIPIAAQYYDMVIVDLEKGLDTFTNKVLDLSDVIVYGINQNMKSLNNYLNSKMEGFLKDSKNVIPLVGKYDDMSKYNSKNIARYISEGRNIEKISYNTLFADSCDEGSAADFFLKLKTIRGEDKSLEIMKDVKSLGEAIKYKMQELQMKI